MYDSSLAEHALVSGGSDGKILSWTLKNRLAFPIRGGLTSRKAVISKRSFESCPGITSLATPNLSVGSSARTQRVIVGLEGGGLMRASAGKIISGPSYSKEIFKNYTSSKELYAPIRSEIDRFEFEKHIGAVNSLEISPFNKNLILTAGQDGCIKLFHLLKQAPLREWEPSPEKSRSQQPIISAISAARFSPIRPLVFAAATTTGLVYLYDLGVSKSVPVSTLEILNSGSKNHQEERNTKLPSITGLAFNQKQRDLLAACDTNGEIHIWRLGWNLSNKQFTENTILDSIAEVDVTSE